MELILWILLAPHLLLGVFYALDWFQDYGRLQETVIRLVLALCFPFVGFLLCKLVDYFLKKAPQFQMDSLYLGHGEMLDELELLRPMDKSAEVDKVPGVDTLRAGEYGRRRRMVMDTLREQDTAEYLSVLKEALLNEDQETSHYASAVIMDLQKRIQASVLERQRAYRQEPEDPQRQEELEGELYRILESGAFDENSLGRYYSTGRSPTCSWPGRTGTPSGTTAGWGWTCAPGRTFTPGRRRRLFWRSSRRTRTRWWTASRSTCRCGTGRPWTGCWTGWGTCLWCSPRSR